MTFIEKIKIAALGLAVALFSIGFSACNSKLSPAAAIAPLGPYTATATGTLTSTMTPVTILVTATSTRTSTPTNTPTSTNSSTSTQTPTETNTPTVTATYTNTSTSTVTDTPTDTPTITNTPTITSTSTITDTPTITQTPTITSTPTITNTWTPCTNGGFFGYNTTGGSLNGGGNSSYMFAMLYNYPSGPNGTLRDVVANTSQTSPIILQGAVYSANPTYPTQPGNLLGQSGSITTTGAGWYTFPIPGDIPLVSGTPYWVCVNNPWPGFGASYGAGYQAYGNFYESPVINTPYNFSVFPDQWPTYGNQSGGAYLPIYAEFCQ